MNNRSMFHELSAKGGKFSGCTADMDARVDHLFPSLTICTNAPRTAATSGLSGVGGHGNEPNSLRRTLICL